MGFGHAGGDAVGQRVAAGKASAIADGEATVVAVGGKDVAVFRSGGQFYAIDDMCPHMGASLSGGHVENGCVTCPWHYWRFRLRDGAWADNPRITIGSYPVHVDGDDLFVEFPERP